MCAMCIESDRGTQSQSTSEIDDESPTFRVCTRGVQKVCSVNEKFNLPGTRVPGTRVAND